MPEPRGIADLLELQRSGGVTAEELAADRLAVLAADGVGTMVEVDAEGALATARALDAARRGGEPMGPLHGVPVTVKSSFAVAGLRASVGTEGSRVRAAVDAPSVARLRAAGAVLLGTTNVPPMLDGFHAHSPLGGRTANPWDPARTPGGSSGGSAAAVGAGLSWGDLGSDLSGSIRVPAAFSGVAGHKPSPGAISKRGHLPWPLEAAVDPPLSVAGPLARSIADLQRLVEVLLRTDPEATTLAPARPLALPRLRVGVWREEPGAACDPEVDAVLDAFLRDLGTAGCELVPIGGTVLGRPESADLFDRLLEHEIAFGGSGGGARSGLVSAWADWAAQGRVRAEWARAVAHVDVVLAPAVPVIAPLHGAVQADADLRARITRWSAMTNLAAVPCTVLPIGLDARHGMPVAVQVVAPLGRDRDALGVARLIQDAGIAPPLAPARPG
ncbi:amidase [Amnibacterium kyonggiense]